jgi:hypothetical protein
MSAKVHALVSKRSSFDDKLPRARTSYRIFWLVMKAASTILTPETTKKNNMGW